MSTVYCSTITLSRLQGFLGHVRLQEPAEDDVEAWMEWSLREGAGREVARRNGDGGGLEMSLARL